MMILCALSLLSLDDAADFVDAVEASPLTEARLGYAAYTVTSSDHLASVAARDARGRTLLAAFVSAGEATSSLSASDGRAHLLITCARQRGDWACEATEDGRAVRALSPAGVAPHVTTPTLADLSA